jgi:hypothetical protein
VRGIAVAMVVALGVTGVSTLKTAATPFLVATPASTSIVETVGCYDAGACPIGFARKCGPYGCICKPCRVYVPPPYYKYKPYKKRYYRPY